MAPAISPSSSATHTTSELAVVSSLSSARARVRSASAPVPGQAVVHTARALVQQGHRGLLVARGERSHGGSLRHGPPLYGPRPLVDCAAMSRFSEPQDPLFAALNTSVGFDFRLALYDIQQSLAHAQMLARAGIIGGDDLEAIERGMAQVRAEVDNNRFVVDPLDEDVHMAIERRLTEIVGEPGAKLHTARSRNDQVATDVAMLVRAHCLQAQDLLRALMGTLVQLAEDHLDWPMPGLHPPPARPARVPLAPSAGLLLEVPARPSAVHLLPGGHRRPAAGRGSAGRGQLRHRPAVRSARAGLHGRLAQLAGRRLQPRLRPGLPVRRRHLRDPPVPARGRDRGLVQPGVRLLRGHRPVRLGVQPDAAEEEPRRRRAAAGEGAAGPRAG